MSGDGDGSLPICLFAELWWSSVCTNNTKDRVRYLCKEGYFKGFCRNGE